MPLSLCGPRGSKIDPGPRDEILHRVRREDLPGAGQGADTSGDVDGDPGDVVASELDLAGVEAGPDLEPLRSDGVADRERGADRARRSVEGGEEPVACRLDLAPAEPLQGEPDDPVVRRERLAPARVAQLGRPLGGVHDVGEEDRRENAIGLDDRRGSGQELLDLAIIGSVSPAHV